MVLPFLPPLRAALGERKAAVTAGLAAFGGSIPQAAERLEVLAAIVVAPYLLRVLRVRTTPMVPATAAAAAGLLGQ